MKQIWLVASHEFWVNIRKRSFLFAVFGSPLLMIGLIGIVLLVTIASEEGNSVETLGYVDNAQVVAEGVMPPDYFVAYADVEAASAALDAEEIDAYAVIAETYLRSGRVEYYGFGSIPDDVEDDIEAWLGATIASGIESDLSPEFLRDPVNTRIFLETTGRELSGPEGFLVLFMVPVIFSFVFILGLQLTSGFLMSGVVEEKTNRIIEVLITSVRPLELLAGKLIGLSGLGFFQLGVWVLIGVVLFAVFGDTAILQSFEFPLDLVLLGLLYFVLTYFLFGSLLAGVGAVVDSEQESRQVAGALSFVIVIPFFVIFSFMEDPNGTIPTLLSYFPFTAGTSMILRSSFGIVPPEQVLLSLALLTASVLLIIWASAKVFRWAILLYGQRVSFKLILRALRGRTEIGVLPTEPPTTTANNQTKGASA